MDSEEPSLCAVFYGGLLDGLEICFDQPWKMLSLVVPDKDESGNVIMKQILKYRLESEGPPLRYEFVSAEEVTS